MKRKPERKLKGLSDNPGTAILQALDDLRACERSKTYIINMGMWHQPFTGGTCLVCLAGSVIARRDSATPLESLTPDAFSDADADKLRALNLFRSSWIFGMEDWTAWGNRPLPLKVQSDLTRLLPVVPDYADPEGFHAVLRQGAKRLQRMWPQLRREIEEAR